MIIALIIIFVVAYIAIALEHPLKINKSASALIGAGLLWTVYAMMGGNHLLLSDNLKESVAATAQIVFFLMGAMTIVEVVDAHNGFFVITSRIKTTKLTSLLWLVGFVSFFLSAILDNLTTTIIMISLMKKLLDRHDDRLFFAGIIVIAANAGGAWSPIGDVTTTMLWIGGQITTLNIMKGVFLPSLACLVVPLTLLSFMLRGKDVVSQKSMKNNNDAATTPFEQNLMFCKKSDISLIPDYQNTLRSLP
jgi:Na+/H+ antiporter NhaD/arsenite permease-like protein